MTTLYTFIIIISSAVSIHLEKFELKKETPNDNNILNEIIQQYSEFGVVVHIDNTTKHVVNEIATSFPSIIFNHDVSNDGLSYSPHEKRLHLATFANTTTSKKLLKFSNYIVTSDIIIFLIDAKSVETFSRQFSKIPDLSKSGGVFVVASHPHGTKIYSACFYCGKLSAQLKLLQDVEPRKALKTPLTINNFENFFGHELRVVYFDYFPFIYCVDKIIVDDEVVCTKAIGWESDLLEFLSHNSNLRN
ncbi:hypothetical protein Zmor_028081 [Zophobas morio]|uniref:Uncharacterized protein n=1 Tax=Zophobas morio TaxID=2755281 RepID=A0AA38HUV2_9CUCU|nr:hypothetical protein Zmor_028081 [Zophobas morio]